MNAYSLTRIKETSRKDRLISDLDIRIKNINALHEDQDYSNLIRNLANAVVIANDLADIKADE